MARKSVRSLLLTALIATPFLSYATQYPLTVTDLDGRQVTLVKEPQRIILQDGRDIMTLALLDRDNPFKRLVAWNNLAKKQDVATWQMLKTAWPQSATILDMGFSDKGNVDLESVIARQPDLMIAQLRARPALMESGVIDKLSALHVPVLFVDYEIDPAKDTAPASTCWAKCLTARARPKPLPITIAISCRRFVRKPQPSRRRPTSSWKRWPATATPAALLMATAAGAGWWRRSGRTISVRSCCRAPPGSSRWRKSSA